MWARIDGREDKTPHSQQETGTACRWSVVVLVVVAGGGGASIRRGPLIGRHRPLHVWNSAESGATNEQETGDAQHEGFAADREKMNALRSTGPRQDEHA